MINEAQFFLAGIFGSLLGGCYFGGLWWTVVRLPHVRHVWRVYFGSLLVRLALVLSSFYLVLTCCGWQLLVACLLGFVASRLLLVPVLGFVPAALATERALR